MSKLGHYGLNGWIKNCLGDHDQRAGGVPQGPIREHVLFNILINDLEEMTELVRKSANEKV